MAQIGIVSTRSSNLNVHPEPSLGAAPVGTVAHGQTVTVLGAHGDWYEIEAGTLRGYVVAKYLTVDDDDAILFPDLYSGDADGKPRWGPCARDPRYAGAIIKATQGQSFPVSWFEAQWPAVREAGGDDAGHRWFRGCYHYLMFHDDPDAQAELYLRTLACAGGLDEQDLPPIVDVERGSQKSPNRRASAQQVVDVTSRWVEVVGNALGRKVMLYGLGAMRDLGITDRMGCAYLWAPHYTRTLEYDRFHLTDIGWSRDALQLWQYTDGQVNLTRYPRHVPGIGPCDTSVFTGSDIAAIAAFVADSRL